MKKAITLVILALLALFVFFFGAAFAHGTTTTHSNSFGAVISDDNPNTYLLGGIIRGTFVKQGDHVGTSISFWPINTDQLHQENVLFCGDVSPMFNGKRGVLAVIYRTKASVNFGGVGCHELFGVYEITADQP